MSYTINPNAKNRWARNAENTMDLSLETDASSVYLDNGRTLEQEIGEGSMVSNVATIDNGMEKVTDGTYDGAYESCKMYGKSLVNLATTHSLTFETVWQSKNVESLQLTGETKYLIMFELNKDDLELTLSQRRDHDFVSHLKKGFTMGLNKTLVTLDSQANGIRFQVGGEAFDSTIQNIMLIKYQEGMEHWDLDYFEGLCDVKAPILKNVGKNLWDNKIFESCPIATLNGDGSVTLNGALQNHWMFNYTIDKGTYTSSAIGDDNGYIHLFWGGEDEFFQRTSPITISEKVTRQGYITRGTYNRVDIKLQLEEGSIITTYEPYKTNILETSNDLVLRGLPSGIRDTYDCLTGEYIRRVGERDYQESDESDSNVITDLVKTHYELAEPIVTQIEPPTTPFAYENGHIILESGHEGQSLLPMLEYSTVINKTGQVESVAKTIQRQEKQLTMLEQMLIQNIINLDYNNTLLTLKNEMEEML